MITIIKKGTGTATHKHDTEKKVFDPYSRKHYGDRYKGMKHTLEGGDTPSLNLHPNGVKGKYKLRDRIQDVGEYRESMLSHKRHYERGHTIRLTPQVKNDLWRKALRLKERIVIGMLSKDELHPVKKKDVIINGVVQKKWVADYGKIKRGRVLERNAAWYKRNEPDLKEFKRIMRVLEPDDPHITGITEDWRPKKGG